MELQCSVQHYDWGKLGSESLVAQFAKICASNKDTDDSKPYAELWMGTHVNGPSFAPETNEHLSVWLARNLDSLGVDARREFGDDLPFLFKVLSIRKALSVQAHPNKKHAEALHSTRPDLYKDPNHKPELAVALTEFEALCAFRKMTEIRQFLKGLPEFQNVIGVDVAQQIINSDVEDSGLLKNAFSALFTKDKSDIKSNLDACISRLEKFDSDAQNELLYPLLKRLNASFPGDVGCWTIYFLNYLRMNPGEAIFLGPNVPHAYLSGDCVECMACSDNVVRAGLTPKFIDVETLVGMLEYDGKSAKDVLFQPQVENQFTKIWRPPVKDFAVAEIRIPKQEESYNTILRPTVSILIVVSGKATVMDSLEKKVKKGSVLYLKAMRQLTINIDQDSEEDLLIYQAMCNLG